MKIVAIRFNEAVRLSEAMALEGLVAVEEIITMLHDARQMLPVSSRRIQGQKSRREYQLDRARKCAAEFKNIETTLLDVRIIRHTIQAFQVLSLY